MTSSNLSVLQQALADYCKTGEGELKSPRTVPYRYLFYSRVEATLRNAYPIAFDDLGEERSSAIVAEFCAEHKSTTPYLWRLPFEFYTFAATKEYDKGYDLPYLQELLLFEWMEIELHMMADQPVPPHSQEGDLFRHALVLNPESRLDRFTYPVFRFHPRELLANRGLYFLFSYRHPVSLAVEFISLSAPYALVLECLRGEPATVQDLTRSLSKHFPSASLPRTSQFLEEMLQKRVVLGFTLD